LRISVRETTG
nr:immunoglobulin heavy chain junction region [Mus musculus]